LPEPPLPHLDVQLRHRVGTLDIDVSFQLAQPWTILFGPSGSGKTSILRAVCGLIRPDQARIVGTLLPGHRYQRSITFVDTSASVFVRPHQRPVRLASQSPELFPHFTLQENLLFGAGWPSKPRDEIEIAGQILTLFQISELADQMPHRLSGGEQQRAAVARALVSATTFDGLGRPILLLDEPFAGLESTLRNGLLNSLKAWVDQWKIPILSVTHDIAEAFQLNAEVIKLSNGRITQQGPAATVLAEERTRLLAQLSPTPATAQTHNS
jgi:molybdate transport system ATP-binding protein